ncbi:hypothetical protein BV25DRAFT_1989029 [Artomyces pyxidatus]|uniref:Uncharacterized protein n=1 Tax=Artomyces pyxidatus TaxID=48021 RepID=A0ACB8TD39_9AGAM|nr:hypothetical protein BV25DRAFT_1989029 [Artomyces pyxidatus]
MPIIYRHTSSHSSPDATITDADDSIVLSDLVRSGEASRLRRRGAIAIRDSPLATPALPLGLSSSLSGPTWDAPMYEQEGEPEMYSFEEEDEGGDWEWTRRPGQPAPDSNEAATGNEFMERDYRRIALDAEIRFEDVDQGLPSHILFCGGDALHDDDFERPLVSSSSSSSPPSPCSAGAPAHRRRASAFFPASPIRRTPPRTRRSNGCGALVHVAALPRRRHGVWIARGSAADTVVGMDASYFDRRVVAKMMKSACGCPVPTAESECLSLSRSGNTLGTIYTPCQAAADGLFSPSSTTPTDAPVTPAPANPPQTPSSPSPRRPAGPAYWLPRSPQALAPARPPPPPPTPPRPRTHVRTLSSSSLPSLSTVSDSSASRSPTPPPSSANSQGTGSRAVRTPIFTFFAPNVRSAPTFAFPHPPSPTLAHTPLPPDSEPSTQYRPTARRQSSSQPQVSVQPPSQPMTPGGVNATSTPRQWTASATWLPPLPRNGGWTSDRSPGNVEVAGDDVNGGRGEDGEDLEGESAEKPDGSASDATSAGSSGGTVWAER